MVRLFKLIPLAKIIQILNIIQNFWDAPVYYQLLWNKYINMLSIKMYAKIWKHLKIGNFKNANLGQN